MKLWAVYALLAVTAHNVLAIDKLRGVQPHLVSKYVPSKGEPRMWTCLDGTQEHKWSAVNDDYCDCADGSDEPGTNACPNSTFYCKNEGHIGSTIRSSHVGDGLCEPECCDGTDEPPGVCPNNCEAIGRAYRAEKEAEYRTRKTGSKIRASYIAFAVKEKRRLEDQVTASARDVATREKEVARLKEVIDRSDSISAAELEKKRESPLYQSLVAHSGALKALKRSRDEFAAKEKALSDILSSLRAGYNPNYQDMAVLEAVRGYEYYAGLPSSVDRDKAKDEAEADAEAEEILSSDTSEPAEKLEEGEWTKEELKQELDSLLDEDFDSLLLEHDQFAGEESTKSVLFNLESYIPDNLLPQYEGLRDTVVELLEMLGIARAPEEPSSGASSKTHQAFQDAEKGLKSAQKEKENAQKELAKLFDPEHFGFEGEWKKLDDECLSKESGDYTYEVCLFGEARQKPLKGGSTFSLGKFKSWNVIDSVEPGSPEYFSKMHYRDGQKCYNGPKRSVTVDFACGIENAITSVSEPEKCEYLFTGTSPALCRPVEDEAKRKGKKDEL